MIRTELIKNWQESQEKAARTYSRAELESLLDSLCSIFTAELLGGGDITLPGLGKLLITTTKERAGRNPRTGAPLVIAARKKALFRASRDFREALK